MEKEKIMQTINDLQSTYENVHIHREARCCTFDIWGSTNNVNNTTKEWTKNIIYTDTVSMDGIESLKQKIIELFNLEEIESSNVDIFTNLRQITLAKECLPILEDVENGIKNNVPVDMVAIDIKRIWSILGEIIGETYTDELIDQLFSQFCLGK